MDFKEYCIKNSKRIQTKVAFICLAGSLLTFVLEMSIFIIYLKFNLLTISWSRYLIVRVIIPTLINTFATVMAFVFSASSFPDRVKNYAAVFAVFICCSTVAIFHTYFSTLMFTLAFPMFISIVFMDKKILNVVGIAEIVPIIITGHVYFFNQDDIGYGHKSMTMLCLYGLLAASYYLAYRILQIQLGQINFIDYEFKAQSVLIEELKIEPSTHLYNKAALEDCMNSQIKKCREENTVPTIVMIDIDDLQKVNDAYGYESGDEVVLKLANIIRTHMGGIRHSFRAGGEKFVLMFENDSLEKIKRKVETIKSDFSKTSFRFLIDQYFTLSAGISVYQKKWDRMDWYDEVEAALYKAKKNGKNRIEILTDKNEK